MSFKDLFASKTVRWIIIGLAELIVLIIIFALGMAVGMHKANFTYRWAENYNRNFGGPKRGLLKSGPFGGEFMSPHGTIGTVLKLEGNSIIIKGDTDKTEKTIITDSSTSIREQNEDIPFAKIQPNDHVVIIGTPNASGQIQAKFIRVFKP